MSKIVTRLLPLLLLVYFCSGSASAQQQLDRPPSLNLGDAVVTGFSGTLAPDPAKPRPRGKSATDLTFINPDGPSARIVALAQPAFVWDGHLFAAPKKFDVLAKDVGQVFGVALDDAAQPNIYLAATSTFGLNIVVRGRNGLPERREKGGPGAGWMKGQFGLDLQGGPGAIYKVDGRSGAVSLFANVTLDGVPNPGPGLGNLAYDAAHKQMFVSDLYTGMIHRFDLDGKELSHFDHGVTALTAAKLAAVPFNPRNRPNIASDRFDAEKPDTWGFAPAARRVWGLAVHDGRLYYSVVSGPQIWSVGIQRDGSFAADPRWELDVPAQAGPLPISDIAFSQKGAMLLAQRALIAAAYDYSALTRPGEPQVFRVWLKGPNDPPSPGRWKPLPEEYAVGFAGNYRNTNGGVALGYGYDRDGMLSTGACEFSLWTTGQNLRNNPALKSRLEPGGPLVVHGLAGIPASPVRSFNEPPWVSYAVDYVDGFRDPRAAGHLGSVRIYSKPCASPSAYSGPGYAAMPPFIIGVAIVTPIGCVGPKCSPPPTPGTPVDVGIVKTGGTSPPLNVDYYDWHLAVTNLGPAISSNGVITVTDVVPTGMNFNVCTSTPPTDWSCNCPVAAGGTLTCTYNGGPVTASQVLSPIDITAQATGGLNHFPPFTNCTTVGLASGSGYQDTNPSNDNSCATVAKPGDCPPPMTQLPNGLCICPTGLVQSGTQCVLPMPPPPPACLPPMVPGPVAGQCICGPGYTLVGKECVKQTVCDPPKVAGPVAGQCICGPGYIQGGKECVKQPTCGPGTVERGGKCITQTVCKSPAKLNRRGGCDCPKGWSKKGNGCEKREPKRPLVTPNDVLRVLPFVIPHRGGGGGNPSGGGQGPLKR